MSDHFAVACSINMSPVRPERRKVQCRAIKKVDPEALASDLTHRLTNIGADMETVISTYESVTREVMDTHAPLREVTIKGVDHKPWYTEDIHLARIERRRLERQYKKTGLTVHRQLLEDQSKAVVQLIKAGKSLYYQEKLSGANCKETFAIVNGLLSSNGGPSLPTHTSDKALADEFIQYFHQKVVNIRAHLDEGSTVDTLPGDSLQRPPPPPLHEFKEQSQEDVVKIIHKCASKSCSLDTIPTALLKEERVLQSVLPSITLMINRSLASGVFPDCMKKAQVTPLLKKNGLEVNDFKNYRPVSNLTFLSKVFEKVVAQQLTAHLTQHNLHDTMQSAYKRGSSTETALLRIKADLDKMLDEGDAALVVLLDLSAAFDTVDHDILIQRLQDEVGLHHSALKWVKSYLSDRTQAVVINGSVSESAAVSIGVPQGSVLGPLLFLVYILPLRSVIEHHSIMRHGFADDTQLYKRLSLRNPQMCVNQVSSMEQCLQDVRLWMKCNKLKLNDSKTEVIIVASKTNTSLSKDLKICIGQETIVPKPVVRNLGATIDSTLSMEHQVSKVTQSAYFHLRRIAKIKHHLTQEACAKAINATVTSRLDFHNGLLLGLPDKTLHKLQVVQNNAARLLTGTRRTEHITPVLIHLHWLPVRQRVTFKVMTIIHKALHSDIAPSYIKELCPRYQPRRTLRSSSDPFQLQVPRATNKYGSRSLQVLGAKLWNELPADIRCISSQTGFRKQLKTVLFHSAYY